MNLGLRLADLPATVLLLPLEPFILLPQTSLPVTLTDAQSHRILDAALAGEGLVGVLQTSPDEDGRFFSVGCLGHVVDLGRGAMERRVSLEGLIRFRIREELPPESPGFPRAAVSYEEFAGDLAAGEEEEPAGLDLGLLKEKIVEFGRRQFGTAGILESLSPRQVILFLAQTAPFTPAEKQALLEAPGLPDLVDRLTRLLSLNFLTTTPDTATPSRAN
jgi:Lon protease-like protein